MEQPKCEKGRPDPVFVTIGLSQHPNVAVLTIMTDSGIEFNIPVSLDTVSRLKTEAEDILLREFESRPVY